MRKFALVHLPNSTISYQIELPPSGNITPHLFLNHYPYFWNQQDLRASEMIMRGGEIIRIYHYNAILNATVNGDGTCYLSHSMQLPYLAPPMLQGPGLREEVVSFIRNGRMIQNLIEFKQRFKKSPILSVFKEIEARLTDSLGLPSMTQEFLPYRILANAFIGFLSSPFSSDSNSALETETFLLNTFARNQRAIYYFSDTAWPVLMHTLSLPLISSNFVELFLAHGQKSLDGLIMAENLLDFLKRTLPPAIFDKINQMPGDLFGIKIRLRSSEREGFERIGIQGIFSERIAYHKPTPWDPCFSLKVV